MSDPQFIRPKLTGASGLGTMLEFYLSCNRSKKNNSLVDAVQLIWSALLKKAIDNAVKDHRKRLQACVSAKDGHFEHIHIHITDTNSYI